MSKLFLQCHMVLGQCSVMRSIYNDNDNDNDKVFYSTLIIHFISHITVINAFAY